LNYPTPLLSTALHYFLAVARSQSISGAADIVNVVPSAISRQVQRLEDTLGCTLFDRQSRGVTLTESGERLLEWALNVQRQADELGHDLQRDATQPLDIVRIGAVEAFAVGFMSRVMSGYPRQHPRACVHLRLGRPSEITRWVQSGEVDFGLRFGLDNEPGTHTLYTDRAPIRAVVAPSHALADCPSLTLAELVAHPLALPGFETTLRQILDGVCRTEKLRYQPRYAGDIGTLLALSAQGDAALLASDYAARGFVRAGSLKSIPVAHPLFERRRVMLMATPGKVPSSTSQGYAFMQHVIEEIQSYWPSQAAAP
jgi:DNA-binding transcriptional LysR family regulator